MDGITIITSLNRPFEDCDYENQPNLLIAHYLILSYLIFELGYALKLMGKYSRMCRTILEFYNLGVEDRIHHDHKSLISLEGLKNASAYYLRGRYPNIVKTAALEYYVGSNSR